MTGVNKLLIFLRNHGVVSAEAAGCQNHRFGVDRVVLRIVAGFYPFDYAVVYDQLDSRRIRHHRAARCFKSIRQTGNHPSAAAGAGITAGWLAVSLIRNIRTVFGNQPVERRAGRIDINIQRRFVIVIMTVFQHIRFQLFR